MKDFNNTFTVGTTYQCSSVANQDCVWTFTITKRTAKFITIIDRYGDETRVGVKIDSDGHEYASPLGSFSMSPIIRA